jgi:prophage maintenance system killer protein
MTDWRFIGIDVIRAIHDQQIADHGGCDGIRAHSVIEIALQYPRDIATRGEPDAADLAAGYAYWLAPGPDVLDLVVDRPSADRFGIRIQTIDQAIYDAFGSRIISTAFAPTGDVSVVLEVAPTSVEDIRSVLEARSIPARLSPSGQVPLSTVVHTPSESRPLTGFIDGNKRVAWEAARFFLADNGYTLLATQIDAVRKMEGVADRTVSEEQLAEWFRDRIRPTPR